MTIKIYSCAGSRGMRPIWTAEEMGLDYELEMMPFPPRLLHKEFMDINILGTVPYMIDGEVHMTESVAMSQYMVDRYGPSDLKVTTNEDDYGNYLNWLSHSDATLTFPQTVFLRYTLQEIGVADEAADGYRRWFIARLKLLEKSLKKIRMNIDINIINKIAIEAGLKILEIYTKKYFSLTLKNIKSKSFHCFLKLEFDSDFKFS